MTLALPAMMQFVLDEQARAARDVSTLRVIFAGGDSVPIAVQERTRELMGVVMVEGLAQTETGPTICNPVAEPRLGSLGRVRFNFNNRFSVFQHDTPNKDYFSNEVRAYSHGCMRVQDPAT